MRSKLKLPALAAAGLLVLYAMGGFLVLPAVARSQAVNFLKDSFGLDLAIGKIRFNPFTFAASLEQMSLSAPGGDRLLAFDAFAVNFELRSLIDRALVFRTVEVTRPYVHIHLRADGTLNLVQAFAGAPRQDGETQDQTEGSVPPLVIGKFVLSGGDIQFTDNRHGRAFDQHFTPLDLRVEHLSTRLEDRSDLVGLSLNIGEAGRLTAAGDLSAIPTRFDVRLTAQDIPLAIAQPYLAERLPAEISDGALSFDLTLSQGQAGQNSELKLAGKAAITRLAIKLKEHGDVVLAWDEVGANGIGLELAPDRLDIEEIAVRGLDTAFRIYADGRTNVGEVLRQLKTDPTAAQETAEPAPPEEAPAQTAPAFPYAIARVAVSGSRLLYSDEQIRPQVAVQIDQLAGEVRELGADPALRTIVALAGRVGEFGKAGISGAGQLAAPKQDLEAKVSFTNIELTSFSPYAGKFAGYTIDKGKLFLDLRYTLASNRIKGENHAVFDQLELGGKVPSEEATQLPVKFALALLRDREGRIDINLPVEGDVDAPGFRLGPLVVKTLVNLLTRIVTAPFDFIAGKFGGGPEMEYAVFAPGDSVLSGTERDKILPLSRALAARPRLIVEIQGWADPAADAAALRQAKYDALLAMAAQGAPPERALETAYDIFFGAGAAAALRTELSAAPVASREGEGTTSAAAPPAVPVEPAVIAAELQARLLKAQPVSEEELIVLAYARSEQVMSLLVQDGGVEAQRVFARRGEISRDGEGAKAKLILDAL